MFEEMENKEMSECGKSGLLRQYLSISMYIFAFLSLCLLLLCGGSLAAETSVESLITQRFLEARKKFGQRSDAGLYVYRITDSKKLYSFTANSFDESAPLLVASATKWVSAAIIMRLIDRGSLSLSSTVGEYFSPLQAKRSSITLEQLLSFQSGLSSTRRNPCADTSDLQSCATQILQGNLSEQLPGGFHYGNAHLAIAAAVAERATGLSWGALVAREFIRPLQLRDPCYYTDALNEELANTPLVAGGLLISTRDYLTFLDAIAKKGVRGDQVWLTRESVGSLLTSRFTSSTKVLFSPFHRNGKVFYQYALGNWVECDTAECREARNSSPGYYGFYPWIDQKEGYYAVLATKAWLLDARASIKSARIVDSIRPLVERLIRSSN